MLDADNFDNLPDLEVVSEQKKMPEALLMPSPLSLPPLETVGDDSIAEGFSPSIIGQAESSPVSLPQGHPQAVVMQQESFQALYRRFEKSLLRVGNMEDYVPLLEEVWEQYPMLAPDWSEESPWGACASGCHTRKIAKWVNFCYLLLQEIQGS